MSNIFDASTGKMYVLVRVHYIPCLMCFIRSISGFGWVCFNAPTEWTDEKYLELELGMPTGPVVWDGNGSAAQNGNARQSGVQMVKMAIDMRSEYGYSEQPVAPTL